MKRIGQIIQSESKMLQLNSTKRAVHGFLSTKHLDGKPVRVLHGTILVARREDTQGQFLEFPRVFCRVIETKSFPKHIGSFEGSLDLFEVLAELDPILEISEKYKGPVCNQNLNGMVLTTPNEKEITEVLRIPGKGLQLGNLSAYDGHKYHLPLRKLYESVFVVGAKGEGKTNCLKHMIECCSQDPEKSAIVVIDLESKQWEYTNLNATKLKHITLSPRGISGGYGLGFTHISPDDLKFFLPELSTKTSDFLDRYARNAFGSEPSKKKDLIITKIQAAIASDTLLHPYQKPALMRAVQSTALDIFDQDGKSAISAQDLLVPGQVTRIDLSQLDQDAQRIVTFYILTVLHNAKVYDKNPLGLILFIDEVSRLFPRKLSSEPKKEYLQRAIKRVAWITHQGRKEHYGIVLATQSPNDIDPELIRLCDTKVMFRLTGYKAWVLQHLGKEFVKEIEDLAKGMAVIHAPGIHEPQRVQMPLVLASGSEIATPNASEYNAAGET